MITYHNGDLLESGCDIICHQVNLQGVMGGGIARQIADRYPKCEKAYNEVCLNNKHKLGKVHFHNTDNGLIVANCFSQELNFDTNYYALKKCFKNIKDLALSKELKTIGVPFNYGCGIANGDWNKVLSIFKEIFEKEENIELQIWRL